MMFFYRSRQSMTFVPALILMAALVACTVQGDNVQQSNPTLSLPSLHLYPVEINGKWGYLDEQGNIRITLPDDVYTIFPFSEGLAAVAKRVPNTHGRWGFVDQTGKVVIENKFHSVRTFSEGLAAV